MTAYRDLETVFARLSRLQHLQAFAFWDQRTMMAPGGNEPRAAAMAELEVLLHQRLTAASVGDRLAAVDPETLDADQRANLREMKRDYASAAVLPASLVEAKSLACARCEHAWARLRPANDWAAFEPALAAVVALAREEADIRARARGIGRYDALLEQFEPGMTSAELDRLFGDVRAWLPDLLQRIIDAQTGRRGRTPVGPFAVDAQHELNIAAMRRLDFDFEHGRLDTTSHPFCGGVPADVRVTTRYDPNDFLSALMSTVHETGHARYEQNRPIAWRDQPLGRARSNAVHESQSLTFEMQLARTPAFIEGFQPEITARFGAAPELTVDNLIQVTHRVEAGLIRVDADEASYPAHIMLRYEIERALIDSEIEVGDIPALWDERMRHYLGRDTRGDFRDGCMQDVHWSAGLFGYFPTYSLGAMLAAQLVASARRAHSDFDARIAAGDHAVLFDWLDRHIWRQASRFETAELIERATGEALNPAYLRAHLEARYLA